MILHVIHSNLIKALLGIFLLALQVHPAAAQQEPDCSPGNRITLHRSEGEELFGSRIQRSMTLLATSSPLRHYPVKIIVYGQSISAGLKSSCLEQAIRDRFPHANIRFENKSISGFSAGQLVRPAALDIYPSYPDLIILHDYGVNAVEFERIIYNIRKYTTSDILLWTHHYGIGGGDSKSQATLERHERNDNTSDVIRYLAQKYNCELADVRAEWRRYLQTNALDPAFLLSDNAHLNESGNKLLVAILMKHLKFNPLTPNDWMGMVKTYEVKRLADEGNDNIISFTGEPWKFQGSSALGESPENSLKMKFTGNRVDVVAGLTNDIQTGTAKVLIDGKAPSANPDLYSFTLPTPAFGASYQPGIRKITGNEPLLVEDWTLRVTEVYDDGSYAFELYGSKTGFDGRGKFNAGDFTMGKYGDMQANEPSTTGEMSWISSSGRIVIDYRDFKVSWGLHRTEEKMPADYEITWSVVPLFTDTYDPPGVTDPADITRVTLAKGLENREHTLEIIPNGDGPVPVKQIVIHTPPIQ